MQHVVGDVGYHVKPEDYGCFVARYPLRDWLPLDKFFAIATSESVFPAACPMSAPEHVLSPSARNWILRESNGTAWFVDAHSRLRWIPDGGTYICLAQSYYVLDNTPWAEIAQFEASVYPGDASCP